MDGDSLDSVVNRVPRPSDSNLGGFGYVNIVDGTPSPPMDLDEDEDEDEDKAEEADHREAEEIDDEDKDRSWMRITAAYLIPGIYSYLQADGIWYKSWVPLLKVGRR